MLKLWKKKICHNRKFRKDFLWLCLIICNRMWFSETKEKIKDLVFFQYRNHLKSWNEGELCFKSAGTSFCYPRDWLFLIKGNRVTCRILHYADCRLLITNKWRMVRKEGKKVLSDSGCSWGLQTTDQEQVLDAVFFIFVNSNVTTTFLSRVFLFSS